MTPSRRRILCGLWGLGAATLAPRGGRAEEGFVILGSTTTTENSGFLDYLTPLCEAATGVTLRVVVAGTGRILRLAEAGDLDLTLTHDPAGEAAFVAARGGERRPMMENDYLIVGPEDDPAGAATPDPAAETAGPAGALARIAAAGMAAGAIFYSRGDDSGAHRRERALWRAAGLAPEGRWYRETGAGMGATLNIAAASGGYMLVDRATWESFGARDGLSALVEGGPALRNLYAVILPAPGRAPASRRADAARVADWLTGPRGEAAIAGFRLRGKQVFFPPAAP